MNRFSFYSIFFLVPLFAQATYTREVFSPRRATYFALAAVGVYAVKNYFFSAPEKRAPVIQDLNIMTFNPLGKKEAEKSDTKPLGTKELDDLLRTDKKYEKTLFIKDQMPYRITRDSPTDSNGPITIISDGYPCHRRPLALYPYNLIKKGVVSGTVVYFTYPTDHNRKMFSFCQEQDIASLDLVIKDIMLKNPQSDVILYGMCKGATSILRYLAAKKKRKEEHDIAQIKAAVIESPLLSIHANGAINPIIHTLIGWTHPNYDPKGATILEDREFPNIPVLIGHLPYDKIALDKDVIAIHEHIKQLKERESEKTFTPTALITINDTNIRHGRMPESVEYVQKINDFIKENTAKGGK